MPDKTNQQESFEQLSLFDLPGFLSVGGKQYSSEDIQRVIDKLNEAKHFAKKREKEEQRRKEQEEKKRREQEEKERKKAHVREVTSMDLPMDWENAFDADIRTRDIHTDSIPDALILSLTTLGKVDIEFMSSITGEDYKTVICTLKGSIYQNPDTWDECFYQGWETAEEYLSGNLIQKLRIAQMASREYNGYFDENIAAIRKVMPPSVTSDDIYITLGSPWVPPDIIDAFIVHLLGDPFRLLDRWGDYYDRDDLTKRYQTVYDKITGTWEIPEKSRYYHSVAVSSTYGTERIEALHILEKTLNMKPITVTNEVRCPTNASGKKRVVNKAETAAALEKQQKLIREFREWVWNDEGRKKRLERIYENRFGGIRRRVFDGSFLTFPGMSDSVKLYSYQKDAVARILFTPNTLLAHDVGSGKTYIMIAAGQELRRMGLSKKNLYVVPNNIVGQWRDIFLTLYPNANLLCIDPKAFTPNKRKAVLKQIRDEDFDGIIMAYSCFEQIELSKEYLIKELECERREISEAIRQRRRVPTRLKRKEKELEKAISKLYAAETIADTLCFDELGITRLFIDEAHNFKNVPIETKTSGVLGVSAAGSKKCRDMMDKVHMVQRKNDGKGVVMATGTPITNSITDAYVIQQYLQSGELAMLDLNSFDSWIAMFAEKSTEFEIDVDTSSYRLATRFARFHNLPELTALLSSVADFHQVDEEAGIPKFEGYSDALIAKTPEFSAYLAKISIRAEQVRTGIVNRSEDNMLMITTDGRKAALDLRLVDPQASFTYQSKAARCSENVAAIYHKTNDTKRTQLIFCDSSTPKAGFNLYSELKERLILLGVPESEIAFIHDARTETERALLFQKVRNGEIRVLIGSTFKLGLGVNVQERLIAVHHLDVPWRPADMTQREGRILRQGNTNEKVLIYRYITEGSFDAYSWQLLETKQRFITGLLSGSLTERSGSDIEDTVLNYAEVKALAVGNPLIKQRVEAANELTRYRALQHKLIESRLRMEKELLEIPGKIDHQLELMLYCEEDIRFYANWQKAHPSAADSKGKAVEAQKRKFLRETISEAIKKNVLQTKERTLLTYRGFDLILPANMTQQKPYLWLKKKGKYYVELGDTDVGNLIRIDHTLDSLPGRLDSLEAELIKLREKEKDLKSELAKKESYADRIDLYKTKVEELDKMLGADK